MTHLDLLDGDAFQETLFHTWLDELKRNPQLQHSDRRFVLSETSKPFFQQILHLAGHTNLPHIQTKQFEPVLKFWHHLLQDYGKQGLTLKELALMVFSLKSTLLRWQEAQSSSATAVSEVGDAAGIDHVVTVLDILGVLTFEVFSRESQPIVSQSPVLLGGGDMGDFGRVLVANSQQMQAVYKAVELVLHNDITVLLEGETGTGKDVIASVIHRHSKRKNKPFVTLNCGAIPKELLESELFGHERGAFTGADQRHIGKFEQAHQGTLFLDEIGEMPLDLQVKLLRVLQNREVERIGGVEKITVDVRVVAATNVDLRAEVDAGRFRKDLYYRLHVFPIYIPPLRERREDIVPLALHFLEASAARFQLVFSGLREDAEAYLRAQSWEGNVRELENMMQRALVLAQGQPITATILAMQPGKTQSPMFLPPVVSDVYSDILPLEEVERRAIVEALQKTEGNVLQTAKKLGISRTTLYQKAKKYGVDLR